MNMWQNIRGRQNAPDSQGLSPETETQGETAQATQATQTAQTAYFALMERVPTPVYYWAGMGSILASLALQVGGKKQAALFVGQWPPTFFILALLYKQLQPSKES